MSVIARLEPRVIPTYPVGKPEKNPLFFEKRVYQGSCGKVYPVPFIDKVFDEAVPITYQSALLENEHVRLVMLPEIGGRIFLGQDKDNNDYDFFYRQDVIKPALVGLAGPWVSGGVEFNWPQHHRPGTFMPTDVHIEEEADGARTVWMSDHDPLGRLKGMHGIRLRPGSSLIELRARLYNRTPFIHTFLWWANVAARVHDKYQSFFPADVGYVADHAVRAMSTFPLAKGSYYGIDYQDRPGANDLSWYRNIPVPTSYMVCQTAFDFFGGYDFAKQGGFVHVANRHIAPGKKQWTWGNEEFGWAWDRELTNEGGPYIELMAGVFTDNQPDFSYLLPYETKTFSQFWWPIRDIGPVQQASEIAALALDVRDDRSIQVGVCVSQAFKGELVLEANCGVIARFPIDLSPGQSFQDAGTIFAGEDPTELRAELCGDDGACVMEYRPVKASSQVRTREQATEPAAPADMSSSDELYLTGEHLEQYRHPTRNPENYWREAIRRDPGDARCHTALGKRMLLRGKFAVAGKHFEQAIARLTLRHPNPVSGEAHYHLGLTLRLLGKLDAAYPTFYKAAWNFEWRTSAYYQLATLDCRSHDWTAALAHLDASLTTNSEHNKARTLKALVLHRRGRSERAVSEIDALLAIDPLDHWAAVVSGIVRHGRVEIPATSRNDAQTILDLALDFVEAGFNEYALQLLDAHHAGPVTPVAVPNPLERTAMTRYLKAWLTGDSVDLEEARASSPDHFFPSRIEEMIVLEWALRQPGRDPVAAYGLGNWMLDRGRHADAIAAWERAVTDQAQIPQVFRNLGIACWNHERDGQRAAECYRTARQLDPVDARILYESDQLSRKRNRPIQERLDFLSLNRSLVLERDDCCVELAGLLNLAGRPAEALDLLGSRRFHPWEGGEGAVLRQYTSARLMLGRKALETGDAAAALEHFSLSMDTPLNLGEAYHPLQAKADVNYWTGRALRDLGRSKEAEAHFKMSAAEAGDFSEMAVTAHSPLSYYRGLSLRELDRESEACALFEDLQRFAQTSLSEVACIDYFATSLPNLLVFDEDLQARRDAENHLLLALAHHGLGKISAAVRHLKEAASFNHADPWIALLTNELEAVALEPDLYVS